MKALLFFALATAASATPDYQSLWADWKLAHKQSYSAKEDAQRFENFKANYHIVQKLNSKGTGKFAMNKFADRSVSDMKGLRGTKVFAGMRAAMQAAPKMDGPLVDTVDWRQKGVVSPIQDQGQCGSCWAFSATSNIESVAAIRTKGLHKLAEQFLVDCDHECGTYRSESGCDAGCNGGLQPNAFKYVIAHGQPAEHAYPYRAVDGTCRTGQHSIVNISGWTMVSEEEAQIARYIQNVGPVSIAVDAEQWSFYEGGIMGTHVCPKKTTYQDLDHGVNIVGFGSEGGQDYWIVRNSWGTDWGENGYCRVPRGTGFCGLQLFACSASV